MITRYLDHSDVAKLRLTVETQFSQTPIIELLRAKGLRSSELLNLKVIDLPRC